MSVAPTADQLAPSSDQAGTSNKTNPAVFLADISGVASIPARTPEVAQGLGFPAGQNIFKSTSADSQTMTRASFTASAAAASGRLMKGDDDDDDIGAAGPNGYGDDDDEGDDDSDDGGGGGNSWLANILSQFRGLGLLGGLFGSLFSGGLMNRSAASGGGCCSGGGCSERMSLRSRVPSLSNRAASPGFGTPISMLTPGFGPFSNNKS